MILRNPDDENPPSSLSLPLPLEQIRSDQFSSVQFTGLQFPPPSVSQSPIKQDPKRIVTGKGRTYRILLQRQHEPCSLGTRVLLCTISTTYLFWSSPSSSSFVHDFMPLHSAVFSAFFFFFHLKINKYIYIIGKF